MQINKIQKISKILYILSKIAFILSIINASMFLVATIGVIATNNNVEVINTLVSLGVEYNYPLTLSSSICICIQSVFSAIIYGFVKNMYKLELEIGTPFDTKFAQKIRKVGVYRIVLPIICTLICFIVTVCFGIKNSNMIYGSSIMFGIVYMIIARICDYGVEVKK